jgi:predicted tellurium resistance membrane protein TerC
MDWARDLAALAQVIMIDIALAGDNAVVVGMAVSGLPPHQKRPAVLIGIGGATAVRVALERDEFRSDHIRLEQSSFDIRMH